MSLTRSMSAPLDDGENQLLVLLGRQVPGRRPDRSRAQHRGDAWPDGVPRAAGRRDRAGRTEAGPALPRGGREWFVALALTEPWLAGRDDYPRPPSNREIFERVRDWHGYAWNLHRPQRVDEAIRVVSAARVRCRATTPSALPHYGRLQNVRFAVARRAAELQLVTAADLAEVERAARNRKLPPGQASPKPPPPS